jgi:hypothetical protein
MALIPLNKFVTKTTVLSTSTTGTVYTAPIGVTSIVLMAQIANISTVTQTVSFAHHRTKPVLPDAQGNGRQDAGVNSLLVSDFAIPPGDAASVLSGKLIIESLDKLYSYVTTDAESSGTLQLVLSVLETANS